MTHGAWKVLNMANDSSTYATHQNMISCWKNEVVVWAESGTLESWGSNFSILSLEILRFFFLINPRDRIIVEKEWKFINVMETIILLKYVWLKMSRKMKMKMKILICIKHEIYFQPYRKCNTSLKGHPIFFDILILNQHFSYTVLDLAHPKPFIRTSKLNK